MIFGTKHPKGNPHGHGGNMPNYTQIVRFRIELRIELESCEAEMLSMPAGKDHVLRK